MPNEIDPTLDATALEIKRLAEQAQAELNTALFVGPVTTAEIMAIQNRFNAAYVQVLAKNLTAISPDVWDVRMVKGMQVSGVKLADKLYRNATQTANEVSALIKEHAQGHMQARELAMRLYDGYQPGDGIVRPLEGAARAKLPQALRNLTVAPIDRMEMQRVLEQGQRYAQGLKTEALKAAYMESLKAYEKQSNGLERRLEIAHKEKTRYMANRIAQTELARAHQNAVALEFMGDDSIEVVQVMMSASHPKTDICDYHSKVNLYGLGPGCYPKAKAPKPIFHPFCRCFLRSRPSLTAAMARDKPGAEAAYLRSLGPVDGARVMGSRDRLQRVLNGASVDDVVNATKQDYYKLERLGTVSAMETPQTLNLPTIKSLKLAGHSESALPASDRSLSIEDALTKLRAALSVVAGGSRAIATPSGVVTIDDDHLLHIVEKRADARERYAHLILPTLERPTEVWLSPYGDGELRKRYVKLFSGPKYDLLVVVKTTKDGRVLWNAIPMEASAIEKQRSGKLLWKSYK
jgi:hypothetical protein